MAYDQAVYTQDTPFATKQIVAGGTYTTRKVTILSGENLEAGSVLGKVTASSKYKLSASAAGDGSQTPDFVLAHDCDASGGDAEALVYETCSGGLVADALILGAGHTIASIRDGLRDKGLPISG